MTRSQAETLLAAMSTLKEIVDESTSSTWKAGSTIDDGPVRAQDFGRLAGVASVVGDSIFDVLNVASNYCNDTAAEDAIKRSQYRPAAEVAA